MDATAIKYAVACVAVLAFTGWKRDVSMHAFAFSGLLAGNCVLTNILNHTLYYPEALAPYPVMDLICGALVALSVWRTPRVWNVALSTTFLIQCAYHALFWVGQAHGQGYETVAPYMDNLSDIFKVQLALVCIPGGVSVARGVYAYGSGHFLRLLLRPRRGLNHRHAGSVKRPEEG